MKREFKGIQRKGLPGGPHEQFTYVTGVFMQDMYHVPEAQNELEKYQTKGEFNFNDLISKYQKSGWESLTKDEQDLYRDNYDNLYYDEKQKSWRSDKPVVEVTADATGRYKELKDYKNWLTDWYSSDIAKDMMTEGYKKEYEGTDFEGSVDPRQLAQENLQERIKNITGKKKLKHVDPNRDKRILGYVLSQSENRFHPIFEESRNISDVQKNINFLDRAYFDTYLKTYDYDIFDNVRQSLRPDFDFRHTPKSNKLRSLFYKNALKKAYQDQLEAATQRKKEWDEMFKNSNLPSDYDDTDYPKKEDIVKQTIKLDDLNDEFKTIYYRPETDEYTIPHELGHLSTGSLNLIPNQDIRLIQEEVPYMSIAAERNELLQRFGPRDLFGNPIKKETVGKPTESQHGFFRSLPFKYYDNPTEVQTRLNVARYQAKDKIGWDPTKRKATMDDVMKLKEIDELNIQDLFDNYTPEHILKMLNSIVMEDTGNDMFYGQKGLEKYQGNEKSETKESRKDFIKRYNETPFKYLNAMAGDFVKFDRDLTKEEIEELGIITDDPKYFDIISSSLGQVRNLGKNRRYGISDMDEYAEIPKNSELWKEIYKQDKKNQRESYLEHKLKDRQWTGKKEFKITQNVIDELNYLKGLKEGDKDFFRKYDTDVIEDSILKAYGIYDQDLKSLRKRVKYNKSANDFAKELSQRYIYGDEPIPTLNEGQEIIVSKDGQYAHPGKITRIPGNNITMKGVPYPVFAIPNVGMPTMMQSGQDYYFPDADYVDEIPMMQDGGFFDKYVVGPLTGRPLRDALRRRLYESVTPIGYDPLHAAKEFAAGKRLPFKWNNYMTSYKEFDEHPMFMDPVRGRNPLGEYTKMTSDDTWNYLLNREQKFNTLRPSKNKPSINTGEDIETMSFVDDIDIFEEAKMLGIFDKNIGDTLKVSDSSAGGFALDNYTLSKGRDSRGNYISYYDRYDINPKLFGMGIPVSDMVGKGEYDLYGRMYYNPVTRERIYPETQITNLPETIRKRVQNVGIEEEDGTIYTPFALPTATVTADVKQKGGALPKYQISGPENIAQVQSDNTRTQRQKIINPVYTLPEVTVYPNMDAFGRRLPTISEAEPFDYSRYLSHPHEFLPRNLAENPIIDLTNEVFNPFNWTYDIDKGVNNLVDGNYKQGALQIVDGIPIGGNPYKIFKGGYKGAKNVLRNILKQLGIEQVESEFTEEEEKIDVLPFLDVSKVKASDVKKDGGAIAKKQLNSDLLKTYKNYINGVDESAEAVRAYDKLNRIFYKESKLNNMSAPNYIMTHIIANA